MDLLFSFDKPACGRDILERKEEIDFIINSITTHHRGVSIIDAPKSGKETVVRGALDKLTAQNYKHLVCEMDFFNVSTYDEFINLFKKSLLACFDKVSRNSILPFQIDPSAIKDDQCLTLPQTVAAEAGVPLIIYIKEFQNVLNIVDDRFSIAELEKAWLKLHNVIFIITGSGVNAMKSVFTEKKQFYYLVEPLVLNPIPKRELVAFITKEILNVGRDIQREQAEAFINVSGGNLWYIKQLCAISFTIPAGYVNQSIVEQSIEALVQINVPRFRQTMSDLTPNQINFLKAIVDGCKKLSSSECLDKYHLNSSANVFRLKDAFKKKELVTFDANDEPNILDPLFEYWLRISYFSEK